jgi:hypothetical protein
MPYGNGLHQLLGHPDAVQDADMEIEYQLVTHGIDPEGCCRSGPATTLRRILGRSSRDPRARGS